MKNSIKMLVVFLCCSVSAPEEFKKKFNKWENLCNMNKDEFKSIVLEKFPKCKERFEDLFLNLINRDDAFGEETIKYKELNKGINEERKRVLEILVNDQVIYTESRIIGTANLQRRLDVLQAEKLALKHKIVVLEQQMGENKAAQSLGLQQQFEAEKTSLEQQIFNLQEQCTKGLQEQIKVVQAEKSVLEQKVKDLEQVVNSAELQKKLSELQIEKSKVEQKIVTLELQALISAEEQGRLHCENSELINRLDSLINNLRPQGGASLIPLIPVIDLSRGMDIRTERAASRSGSSSSSSEDLKKSKNKNQETAPVATAVVEEEGDQPTTSRRATLEPAERPNNLQGQMVVQGSGIEIDEASTSDVEPI